MALSFLGLGFSFGGKDENLSKTLDNVSKKFDTVQRAFTALANGAKGLGSQVSTGLSRMNQAGGRALGGITGALDTMASRALNPKIDNAFSSMNAQFAKTWGEVTVGMNMTGKEANKWQRTIGSAAFALNADMGQTAKSWVEFRKQGVKLDELFGVKGMSGSIKTLIKVTSTFGMEGQQIALMASGLIKGFDFTEKKVRLLMGTVYRMGKAFNVGQEMMQEMPGILSTINKELADFGTPADRKNVDHYTQSIVKLSVGFKEALGMSAKDATATAKGLFGTLMGERRNLVDMFRGMGGEFTEFSKALAEKGGVRKALMMVLQDPAKFMDKLREMAKKTAEQGGTMGVSFQRLVGVMNKTLGPDVTYAMKGNWDKASGAMSVLDKIATETTKNLKALTDAANKAYKSGRTEGDAFTIMLQSQEARIHKLSAPAMTKWIGEQKKGFDKFYGGLKEVADEKGPLGELTRRLLLVQRVGLSGLFSGLGGMGPMITKTVQEMGPMLAAFAHFGMALSSIKALLLPGGVILLGLAMFHKGAREKIMGTLEKVWAYVQKNVPKWIPMIRDGIAMLWQKAIEGVKWGMGVATPMLNRLASAIAGVDWGGIAMRIVTFVGKFFRGVFDAIFGTATSGFDTSTVEGKFAKSGAAVIGALGRGMLTMLKVVLNQVYDFFFDWSDGLGSGMENKGKLLGGIFVTALFFGSTRKLALQGAWAMVRLVGTYLIAPILAMMGQFFLGMLAKQGTYLAVAAGTEKASYAKRLGMAITYHAKNLVFAAGAWAKRIVLEKIAQASLVAQKAYFYMRHLVMSAAFWARDALIDANGWLQKKLASVAGMVGVTAVAVAGWIATNAANAAGWTSDKIVDAAGWITKKATAAAGWIAMKATAAAGWIATIAINAAGWAKTNAIALAGAVMMAAKWAIAFWPLTAVIATIALLGLAFYSLTGKLGETAKRIGTIITWPFMFLWQTVKPLVDAIKTLFSGDLGGALKGIFDFIGKVITAPFRFVYGVAKNAVDLIAHGWNWLRDKLGETGKSIMDAISYPFRQIWSLVEGIVGRIKGAWGSITGAVGRAGSWIKDSVKSIFTSSEEKSVAVADTISKTLADAAKAAERAAAVTTAKNAQANAKIRADAGVTATSIKSAYAVTKDKVSESMGAMRTHTVEQLNAMGQMSAQTANAMASHSQQATQSTSASWSVVPPFLGRVFTSAVGASAQANTTMTGHSATAAKTTEVKWGDAGQYTAKVWAETGKNVLKLWDGITTGAIKSSTVLVESALRSAKAMGVQGKALKDLEDGYLKVTEMAKEHADFAKKQKTERALSYYDLLKEAGDLAKQTAIGTGMKLSDVIRAKLEDVYKGKSWKMYEIGFQHQLQTREEQIKQLQQLQNSAADREKGFQKGVTAEYAKQLQARNLAEQAKLKESIKKTDDALKQRGVNLGDVAQYGTEIAAKRAVERYRKQTLVGFAREEIARQKAYREAVTEFAPEQRGLRVAQGQIVGLRKMTEGQRKLFDERVEQLKQRYMKQGGGMAGIGAISAPTISGKTITAGAVTPPGASATGKVVPGSAMPIKEEKRVNWTVSDETQKVMTKVSTTIENVAAAITNIGRPVVTVTFTGDIAPFLKRLKQDIASGYGNLAARQT